MPGRNYNAENYRFSFNGKEDDIEANIGYQDYGLRFYDKRLERFFSVDPLFKDYPWNSTYAFAENDVIRSVDLDGAEKFIQTVYTRNDGTQLSTPMLELSSDGDFGGGILTTIYNSKGESWLHYQGDIVVDQNGVAEKGLSSFSFKVSHIDLPDPGKVEPYQNNIYGEVQQILNNPSNNTGEYVAKLAGRILYDVADDAYVYGSKLFSHNGPTHLDNSGADSKELYWSALSTLALIIPSPKPTAKIMDIGTFNNLHRGTDFLKGTSAERGLKLRQENNMQKSLYELNRDLNTTDKIFSTGEQLFPDGSGDD